MQGIKKHFKGISKNPPRVKQKKIFLSGELLEGLAFKDTLNFF